jgi:hypothetical protein
MERTKMMAIAAAKSETQIMDPMFALVIRKAFGSTISGCLGVLVPSSRFDSGTSKSVPEPSETSKRS